MINVVTGDEVVFIKAGRFGPKETEIAVGARGRVVSISPPGSRSKKTKAWVQVYGAGGNSIGPFNVPGWWLRPRSVLDDLAEI